MLSFFQPISKSSGENGKSIIKIFGNDIDEFNRILEQLNKNDNIDNFANKIKAVKELLAGNTATKLELSVSDEDFQTRLTRDKDLINNFYNEIRKKQSQQKAINISEIASQVGITDTKTPNLYAEIIQKTTDDLGDAESVTKDYVNAQEKQRSAILKSTKATIGQRVAITALNTALSMAAGIGINLLIQGIEYLLTYEQKAIDKANELVNTYNQQVSDVSSNVKTLEGLQSEYNKLSQGVDKYGRNISLTTDEYERYRDIVEEVLRITPSLRTGYDEEGNAIANKNDLIERSIALLKEQLKLEREEMLSSENLWDVVYGYRKEYDRIQTQQNASNIKNRVNIAEIAGLSGSDRNNKEKQNFLMNYLGMDEDSFRAAAYGTADGLKKLENQLLNEIDEFYNAAATRPDIFSEEDLDSLDQMIEKSESYVQSLDRQNKKILSTLQQVPQLSDFYDTLNSDTQNFLNDFINSLSIDLDKIESSDDIQSIKNDLINLTDAISNDSGIQSAIKNFYSLDPANLSVEDYKKQVEKIISEIQKALPENEDIDYKAALNVVFSTDQDIDSMVQAARDKVGDALGSLDEISVYDLKIILDPDFKFNPNSEKSLEEQIQEFVENNKVEVSIDTSILSENFKTISDVTDKATSALNDYKSAVTSLNDTIDKLNEGTALSGSEMLDLIMAYPELASQIQVTNEGYTVSVEVLKELREQELLKAQEGIEAQIQHAKAVVESSMSIIEAYGLQINAIKSLAEAEAAIAGNKTGLFDTKVEDYGFDENGILSTYQGKSLSDYWGISEEGINTLTSKVQASLATLKYGELQDQLNALKQIDVSKNFNPPDSSKDSNDSVDKWLEAAEKEREALDHLYKMEQIDRQQYYDGIEKIDKKYFAGREKYISEHRQYLEDLFDLEREMSEKRIEDQNREIENLKRVRDAEISRIESMSSQTYKNNTEAINSSYAKINEIDRQQVEKYKQIINEINNQLKAAYDYGLDQHSDYVQELEDQWYQYNQNIIDIYKNQQSELEQQMDEFKSKQSSIYQEFLSVWDKEIESLNEAKNAEQEYWDQKIEDYKKEHEELEEINELEEKRIKLQNLKNQKNVLMYDKEKGWIRTYDHNAVDEAQKDYDDALAEKEYQDGLEDLEDRRDAALSAIDDEIKAIEELKKQWEDSLDEINKKYDYTEDELKAFADFENMTHEQQVEFLGEFVTNYNSTLDIMISKIDEVRMAFEAATAAMNEFSQAEIDSASSSSSSNGSYNNNDNSPVYDGKYGLVTWKGENVSKDQMQEWINNGWSYVGNGGWKFKGGQTVYKMGGVVSDTGLAKLHGDSVHSEVVFNSSDAKKLYDYIHGTPNLINELVSKISTNLPNTQNINSQAENQNITQHFHISQLSFPNVVSGQDVIDAIRELPNFIIQNKFKK